MLITVLLKKCIHLLICSFVFKSIFLLVMSMICVLPLGVINDDDDDILSYKTIVTLLCHCHPVVSCFAEIVIDVSRC